MHNLHKNFGKLPYAKPWPGKTSKRRNDGGNFVSAEKNDRETYAKMEEIMKTMESSYLWSKKLGSDFTDQATGIAQTPNGQIYIAGITFGNFEGLSNNYSPTLNRNYSDIFAAKFSQEGDRKWVNLYGTGGSDYAGDIAINSDGHALIGGTFAGNDYDATYFNISSTTGDIFNQRYGAGFSADTISALDLDSSGTVYYAGVTSSSRFNGERNNDTSSNPYLVKTSDTPQYNENGTLQYYAEWTNLFNSGYGDYGFGTNISSIDIANTGAVYITSTGSNYNTYSYLHRIDYGDSITWSVDIGNTGGSGPYSATSLVATNDILSTNNGGIYVAGSTGRGDYYGENPNNGFDTRHGFISRFSENGFHEWSIVIPDEVRSWSSLNSIQEKQNGNILVSGQLGDSSGEYGYLTEIDPNGNTIWSWQSDDELSSIKDVIQGIDGFTYILGGTDDNNVFLAKLNLEPTSISLSATDLNENIAGGSTIATLSSTDQEAGDTHTYSLVDGIGDSDNSKFRIEDDQLKIIDSPDYETQSSYSIRLQTTDSGNLSFENSFTLNVNDIKPETTRSSTDHRLVEGVENLVLTGKKHLKGYGNSGNNRLTGNSGNNLLDGKGGVDVMVGKAGNDTYVINHVRDRVIEKAKNGTDTIKSTVNQTLSANVENLILKGTGNLKGYGNSGKNRLIGTRAGNNLLDGKGGADTMIGKGGNDTYIVNHKNDRVIERQGEGTDTIRSSVDEILSSNVENLVLTGTDNLKGYGNSSKNRLTGNSGNNALEGRRGKDILTGKGGGDRFIYQSIRDSGVTKSKRDIITDFDGTESDKIDLSKIDAYSKESGNQAFVYIGSDSFSGTQGEVQFASGILSVNTGTDTQADMQVKLNRVTYFNSDFLIL